MEMKILYMLFAILLAITAYNYRQMDQIQQRLEAVQHVCTHSQNATNEIMKLQSSNIQSVVDILKTHQSMLSGLLDVPEETFRVISGDE